MGTENLYHLDHAAIVDQMMPWWHENNLICLPASALAPIYAADISRSFCFFYPRKDLTGNVSPMRNNQGKILLIVNTATYWG